MNLMYAIVSIYNEHPGIIKRCFDSIVDVMDIILVIIDKKYDQDLGFTEDYNCNIMWKRRDLDNSIVEEWRNYMLQEAEEHSADWVLIIDPDEYLDYEAHRMLEEAKMGLIPIEDETVAFAFPRKNYEKDHTGTVLYLNNYPDYQVRLVRPHLRYSGKIHEPIIIPDGEIIEALRGHIVHDKRHVAMDEWHRKLDLFRSKGGYDEVPL